MQNQNEQMQQDEIKAAEAAKAKAKPIVEELPAPKPIQTEPAINQNALNTVIGNMAKDAAISSDRNSVGTSTTENNLQLIGKLDGIKGISEAEVAEVMKAAKAAGLEFTNQGKTVLTQAVAKSTEAGATR